jgi:hypothetical protein
MKSIGAPADLTNVTSADFIALYNAGVLPSSFLTGNASDTATIYALGRDVDSGTRAVTFSETGFGAASVPVQYAPYDTAQNATNNTLTGIVGNTGSGGTINGLNFYPAETVDGISGGLGAMGYASGGNLATAMKAPNALNNAFFVTYLGISDAVAANNGGVNGASYLNFNGEAFTTPNVETGAYTFWGNEGFAYLPSNANIASGAGATFRNGLQSAISGGLDQLSSGGVTVSAMLVSRLDDGNANEPALINTPIFPY